MRARTRLAALCAAQSQLAEELDTYQGLLKAAQQDKDASLEADALAALEELAARAHATERQVLFGGEADSHNAYVEIHAGAGGTESQDWTAMLLRMYRRWAERHEFRVKSLSQSEGEEAGLKSATLLVEGAYAFGWLKTESGVHRLVRISPFDAQARRHTSFASVWCYPEVDEEIEIEVAAGELRVDTYRASGAGGQHVNTTDSAVRLTHAPSGIVVQCQSERSQHQNRATAMAMLKARLYEQELKKREEKALAAAQNKTEIGWGHQIRSYVLQPYQLVKDLRTQYESSDPQGVLDGSLDDFMEAALAQRLGSAPSAAADADDGADDKAGDAAGGGGASPPEPPKRSKPPKPSETKK